MTTTPKRRRDLNANCAAIAEMLNDRHGSPWAGLCVVVDFLRGGGGVDPQPWMGGENLDLFPGQALLRLRRSDEPKWTTAEVRDEMPPGIR